MIPMVNTIGPTTPAVPTRRVTRKSEANTSDLPMSESSTDRQQRTVVYERRKGKDRRKERRRALLDLRAGSERRRNTDLPSIDIDV